MTRGCPEGMYPMDMDYEPETYSTFAALREAAEGSSDVLNVPISWYFSGPDSEYGEPEDVPEFKLVFLMPRKNGRTWGLRTENFDRDEVQAWLDTWLRAEINTWFGWEAA